jgi:hypothetical protein
MTASTTIFAQQEQDFENDCEPVDQGVSLPVWIFFRHSECPKRGSSAIFANAGGCEYENGCVASGAGYLADDDREPLVQLTAIRSR